MFQLRFQAKAIDHVQYIAHQADDHRLVHVLAAALRLAHGHALQQVRLHLAHVLAAEKVRVHHLVQNLLRANVLNFQNRATTHHAQVHLLAQADQLHFHHVQQVTVQQVLVHRALATKAQTLVQRAQLVLAASARAFRTLTKVQTEARASHLAAHQKAFQRVSQRDLARASISKDWNER